MELRASMILLVLGCAGALASADEPPRYPPPMTGPVPEPAPPVPPSPYVWAVGLGLGGFALDHGAAGCAGCSGSPAIGTSAAFAVRALPGVAIGIQGAGQLEFVSGRAGQVDVEAGWFAGFGYAQLDMLPGLQLVGGAGYGLAMYQYRIPNHDIFGTSSGPMHDLIGSGPALLAAVRFQIYERRWFQGALELRTTVVQLTNAGTTPGISLDFVGGRF